MKLLFTLPALAFALQGIQAGVLLRAPRKALDTQLLSVEKGTYIVQFAKSLTSPDTFYSRLNTLGVTYELCGDYIDVFHGITVQIADEDAEFVAGLDEIERMWPDFSVNIHGAYGGWAPTELTDSPQGRDQSPEQKCKPKTSTPLERRYYTTSPIKPALPMPEHRYSGVKDVHEKLNITGAGIKIAIIDSGLDYHHPAFGGCYKGEGCRVAFGYDFVGDNFTGVASTAVPDDDPYDDCHGHGTHLAGILAGNHRGKFLGVAPDATLGIYRVISCKSESKTALSILVSAMVAAYGDGANIVSLSIGEIGGWSDSPTSIFANKLRELGVITVASVGNEGADALWGAGAPAVNNQVVGVASAYPTKYYANYITTSLDPNYRIPCTESHYLVPAFEFTDVTVVAGVDSNGSQFGCGTFKQSVQGSVVLVYRGGCAIIDKVNYAKRAGAIGLMMINSDDHIDAGVELSSAFTIPFTTVGLSDGQAIWNAVIGNTKVTFTATADYKIFEFPLAGKMAPYSSWGPGSFLDYGASITTVGSLVYSTLPLSMGGYGIQSGTSMATPYAAGLLALMKQRWPDYDITTLILKLTSVTTILGGDTTNVSSVLKQGNGKPQMYHMLYSKGLVGFSQYTLNDTASTVRGSGVKTYSFIFHSTHNKPIEICTHPIIAQSVTSYDINGSYTSRVSGLDVGAKVRFPKERVVVPSNSLAFVNFTVTEPASLAKQQHWLYSGFIRVTTNETTPKGEYIFYYVSYMGYKGNYKELPVLNPPSRGLPTMVNLTSSKPIPANVKPSYGMLGTDRPAIAYRLEHNSKRLAIYLYDPANPDTPVGMVNTGNQYNLVRNFDSHGNVPFTYSWDGYHRDNEDTTKLVWSSNGDYFLRFYFLRPFGNATLLTDIYVNVLIKKLRPEDVTVDITEHSLSVNVQLSNHDNFELDLNTLGGVVDPSQSGYEILSTKLEIYLQKKVVGYQWAQLKGSRTQPTIRSATVNPSIASSGTGAEHVPSYPSSSKKAKNWDKLVKEAENDDFDKPDGDRALNELFQQIYRDADEETRRAMMKSFVESNGTCLSTNWEEVSKGKVETKPPEGMAEKKYSA
ncbi:hypothetical protein IWQ61_002515 [Dispira simplex]|nr:hypothetical protein IWQ61_002515 [Dispira simplex]